MTSDPDLKALEERLKEKADALAFRGPPDRTGGFLMVQAASALAALREERAALDAIAGETYARLRSERNDAEARATQAEALLSEAGDVLRQIADPYVGQSFNGLRAIARAFLTKLSGDETDS